MTARLWADGAVYEPYVGRWSRLVAAEFVSWLDAPAGGRWLDVGCGTGAVTDAVLRLGDPVAVLGVDPSTGFVRHARSQTTDPRARFAAGTGVALPVGDGRVDVVVSGLVLNFVPEPGRAATEMVRVVRPGGVVGAYVWDYAGRMEFMRHFWDAAGELDPAARELDEGLRFPLCRADPLRDLFAGAGLSGVRVRPIDVPTRFADFDDYWTPFLGGQAPAPRYAMSLDEERRTALRERLRSRLPYAADGSIPLVARAWAVRGSRRA